MSRRELPFGEAMHLRNPWNDGKPVKIGRDGQVRDHLSFHHPPHHIVSLIPDNLSDNLTPGNLSDNHTPDNLSDNDTPYNLSDNHTPDNPDNLTPDNLSDNHTR